MLYLASGSQTVLIDILSLVKDYLTTVPVLYILSFSFFNRERQDEKQWSVIIASILRIKFPLKILLSVILIFWRKLCQIFKEV